MGNYIHKHPTGDIVFQSWDHYNRWYIYEGKNKTKNTKTKVTDTKKSK